MKTGGVFCLAAAGLALQAAQPHPLMREYNRAWQLNGQLRADEAIPLLKQIIAKDKTFYRAYGTLAEAYQQKNELDKAEQYFRSLLAQDTGNGSAHYGLGEIYFNWKRQWDVAAAHYIDCIQKSPQTYPCYGPMISALQFQRKHTITAQDLQPTLLRDLKSPFRELLLATMYQKASAPPAATAMQAALRLARSRNDPELIALLEYSLARSLGWSNEYAKLLQPLENALSLYRQLEDLDMQYQVTQGLGRAYARMGNFERARIYHYSSLELARSLGHRAHVGYALSGLGSYHNQQGDQEAALRLFREAKHEYETLNDQPSALAALFQIGSIYEGMGELGSARDCFAECYAVARRMRIKWHEAFALRRLGDIYRDSGEYLKALNSLTEAVRIFQENGFPINVAAGLRVIASVHSALGNYSYARHYYEQSLSGARDFSDTEQQERTLQGLGRLYLRVEQPKQALNYLKQALSISDRTHSTALRSGALRDAGDAYRLLGDADSAIARLNEALRIARQFRLIPDEAAAFIGLGRCHLNKGRLAQSEECFRESLGLSQRSGISETILAAREGLAQTCLRRGALAQALRHLLQAIETIESLRARIPTPELRSSFVQQNSRVYELIIDALARMHGRDPAAGYDRQAFAYLERGRARLP